MTGLRGKAAIIGAGIAGIGDASGLNYFEITAEAVFAALEGTGLALTDIDGVFGASMARMLWPVEISEYLGLNPVYCDGTQIGGSSFEAHAISAAMALDAGLCEVALICFGATTRSMRGPWPAFRDTDPYLDPYQIEGLHTYAMAMQRHMHEYGTRREDFADVAVAARQWASLNPSAFRRGPLDREEVLGKRLIASPLTSADCCLVTDGAAAVIMTRADRATAHAVRPAYLLGGGIAFSHMNPSQARSLTTTAALRSGQRAYAMSGLRPTDIDCVQLYDAFTVNVILFLEDLGFCAKGEGGAFVREGNIAPGGALPVNTNGGGLSCVHPGMYGLFMLVEAFDQITGRAGARQIARADTIICHGNGGNLSAQATTIWGSGAAI